jgi:hypothetical protein
MKEANDHDTTELVDATELEAITGGGCVGSVLWALFNPGDIAAAVDAGIACSL